MGIRHSLYWIRTGPSFSVFASFLSAFRVDRSQLGSWNFSWIFSQYKREPLYRQGFIRINCRPIVCFWSPVKRRVILQMYDAIYLADVMEISPTPTSAKSVPTCRTEGVLVCVGISSLLCIFCATWFYHLYYPVLEMLWKTLKCCQNSYFFACLVKCGIMIDGC